ncbi:mycofactocin system FadH/OYE family oxidoreductase 2 [Cryptosporangium minutisporangium]|uniref:FAD-dependent oxidoreductase n=1 Tax=Cryptosporangium minutisporangium TaxID=113569 RepID=A0ABP6T8K2_9ACTN
MTSLFTPLRLGRLTLRNRVVFSAHLTNFAEDGLPSARHVEYYRERAAGGAGLVITEEHTVHPSDQPYEKMIRGYDPAVVPRYRALTAAVHAHGTPILAQLNHNGGQASGMYTRRPVLAPSPVPDALFREVPLALDTAGITEIVAGYATTARHCVDGGFDGVELQASHSSLIRGFLSRATNRRTDDYGVDRSRFLREVIAAVRAAIGPDAVLGVRLGGDEMIDDGVTLDEGVATARTVDATGAVDYLNTSIGLATETLFLIQASMRVPPRYALHVPAAMRAAVSVPVIGVGRFKHPAQAEKALDAGYADLIGVVRGQIADPSFAAKAAAGRADEIRTCLSCNQECVGRVGFNRWIGCVVNPVVLASPMRRSLRVAVVGGGPGGLRAAVTAAERGHRVTLYERSAQLGGQVPLAARVPSRAEFAELTRSLALAAARAGVSVRAGVTATPALLAGSEAVVLATGARPVRPSWARSSRVVDVRQVLSGRVEPYGDVLVHDELGFHQATSVAELLADRGCTVEIATPGMIVGQDLGVTLDLELWTIAAEARGIRQTPDVTVATAEDSAGRVRVVLAHHPTGTQAVRTVDWVVSVVHPEPEDALWHALRGAPFPVHRVGDCLAPRRADAAVLEGERVAMSL